MYKNFKIIAKWLVVCYGSIAATMANAAEGEWVSFGGDSKSDC